MSPSDSVRGLKFNLALIFAIVLAGSASASSVFGFIPKCQPEVVAEPLTVIGQFDDGVLVLSPHGSVPSGFVFLDALSDDEQAAYVTGSQSPFYRVHLIDADAALELARLTRILYSAGNEYVVRLDEAVIPQILALRAELARIQLTPMVIGRQSPRFPEVMSNPLVEEVVGAVSADTVLAAVRRLQKYRSRYSTSDSARAASLWIAGKLMSYGCDSVYLQDFRSGYAPNVIGIKYGTNGQRNPYAIICGHYDSYAATNAPGADDNASGTVAVLEACRVMRDYDYERDIRFIAFCGEEQGLYGSAYYAGRARTAHDSILGVFNFDMIGYVDGSPEDLNLVTKTSNPSCVPFSDFFIACADTYTSLPVSKNLVSDNQNSDHGPFWQNGYLAFCGIEDFWPTNPHYHTSHDSIGAGFNSISFCTEVTRAAVAALATISQPIATNTPMVSLLRTRLDDAAGNGNGRWEADESIGVFITLQNRSRVSATDVRATLSTSDMFLTLFDTTVAFGTISGQDTAVAVLPFTMKASPTTPKEHTARLDLAITSAETTWSSSLSFLIGEFLATDPVPDGPRSPALYWAYDDIDSGYPEHPSFDWREIRTLGTRITFGHNDSVKLVSLPAEFGPLHYYGTRYTQLSVSADGWVAPGNYTTPNYHNVPLPSSAAPPGAICLNWTDLNPLSAGSGHGKVYYFHDAANHQFIIEYDSVAYYAQPSINDCYQLIIYDSLFAEPNRNNPFVVQYLTANNYSSSTMGIQDQTQTIAINYAYAGNLARGAAPIVSGRAIRYVTTTPTCVTEASDRNRSGVLSLRVVPNPIAGNAQIELGTRFDAGGTGTTIDVFDASGRKVSARISPANGTKALFHWDTRNLASGIYFVRLATATASATAKTCIRH